MYKSESFADRLKNLKSQSNFNKADFWNTSSDNEYPRLREPKPATLLKIQGHQKTAYNVSAAMITKLEEMQKLEVPLRQEFINKKENLEKATTNMLKKYEDSGEVLPLKLHTGSSSPGKKTISKSLNYREHLLVDIFYTKIKAHPNGLFAENLPNWYKKTFDKELDLDWLEVLQASNKFDIEKILNKIVLYIKNEPIANTGLINTLSLKISTTKSGTKEDSMLKAKEFKVQTDSSVGFVRYKHLQKSFEEYSLRIIHDGNTK